MKWQSVTRQVFKGSLEAADSSTLFISARRWVQARQEAVVNLTGDLLRALSLCCTAESFSERESASAGGREVMRSNSYIQKIHKIESANMRTTIGDIAHSDVAVTQDERDVPGREEGGWDQWRASSTKQNQNMLRGRGNGGWSLHCWQMWQILLKVWVQAGKTKNIRTSDVQAGYEEAWQMLTLAGLSLE